MTARVGLDARITRRWSVGMRAYAHELVTRLPHIAPDLEFITYQDGTNFGWDEHVSLPRRMRRDGIDLAHFMSLYAPAFAPRPYVVTIHDLIHLRFPQYFKANVGPYYRTITRLICARAARVITDDERTVNDLARFLHVDRAKVRVIPLGVDDVFLGGREPFRPPRPYLIYAGNHREHKDLRTLFAAWSQLDEDIDLYLTGHDDVRDAAEFRSPRKRIVFLGDVSIEELAAYYAGSVALVHPALCEGFGLPMLEAMASGSVVIACEDAVPGVLREQALTFPARDVRALIAQLERVVRTEGLRQALIASGSRVAHALTWDRCAAETAALYREILEDQHT